MKRVQLILLASLAFILPLVALTVPSIDARSNPVTSPTHTPKPPKKPVTPPVKPTHPPKR